MTTEKFCELFDHQQETVEFALSKFGNYQGILIAHSPGLGKTPTSCVIIKELMQQKEARYSIVIAPKSVLLQWKQHIQQWSQVQPCYYQGQNRKTELKQFLRGNCGVILSTYQTVINDIEYLENAIITRRNQLDLKELSLTENEQNETLKEIYQAITKEQPEKPSSFQARKNIVFDLAIFDEITEIKNNKSQRFLALKQLKVYFKIGLTGTPVMNNLAELYNQIEFLQPGFLGSRRKFLKTFGERISNSKLRDASEFERKVGRAFEKNLIAELSEIMIRYTKEQLQTLKTNKFEIQVWIDFSDIQKMVYEQYLSSPYFINRNIEKGSLGHLVSLRKVCDFLQKVNQNDLPIQPNLRDFILDKIPNNLKRIAYSETENTVGYNEKNEFQGAYQEIPEDSSFSVKFDILVKILKSFQERQCKTIIFSESLTTLNLIKELLPDDLPRPLEINGKTSTAEVRTRVCVAFNSSKNFQILLITTRAGGIGLNIQGASRIILFSPNFNPQLEDQAIARAWRIGQKQDVFVYKFLIRNTIEEVISARQLHKIQIANAATQDILAQIKVDSENIDSLFEMSYEGNKYDKKMTTNKFGVEKILEKIFDYNTWKSKLTQEEILMQDTLKIEHQVNFTICQDQELQLEESEESDEFDIELISQLRTDYEEENQTQQKQVRRMKIIAEESDDISINVASASQSENENDDISKSYASAHTSDFSDTRQGRIISIRNDDDIDDDDNNKSLTVIEVSDVHQFRPKSDDESRTVEIIDISSDM